MEINDADGILIVDCCLSDRRTKCVVVVVAVQITPPTNIHFAHHQTPGMHQPAETKIFADIETTRVSQSSAQLKFSTVRGSSVILVLLPVSSKHLKLECVSSRA